MRPNAQPWVESVLASALPHIQALGPDYLPEASREYGCGAFGCVMPCRSGLVLKVTIDGSEALVANLGRSHPGLPSFVGPVVQVRRPSPVWLLWRDDIEGIPIHEFKTRKVKLHPPPKSAWSRQAWQSHRELIGRGHDHLYEASQNAFALVSDFTSYGMADPVRFWDRVLKRSRELSPSFGASKDGIYWTYHADTWSSTDSTPMRLLQYKWHIQQAMEDDDVRQVADAVLVLLASGLMMCDMSSENIVMTAQGAKLRDCGFCMPLSRRQIGRWEELDFDPRAWFQHDVRESILRAWLGR